jgi:hypothetical protein
MHGWKIDDAAESISKVAAFITSPGFKDAIGSLHDTTALITSPGFKTFATIAFGLFIFTGFQIIKSIREISKKVEKLTEQTQEISASRHQAHFGKHVYEFGDTLFRNASSSEREEVQLAKSGNVIIPDVSSYEEGEEQLGPSYFFIYHPSTDWHSSFFALEKPRPLPNRINRHHKLDSLEKHLLKIRKEERDWAHPKSKLHVLLPSTHKYSIADGFFLDKSLSPIVFEGELSSSGEPYVTLNIPHLDDSCFRHIGRGPAKKTRAPESRLDLFGGRDVDLMIARGVTGISLGIISLFVIVYCLEFSIFLWGSLLFTCLFFALGAVYSPN